MIGKKYFILILGIGLYSIVANGSVCGVKRDKKFYERYQDTDLIISATVTSVKSLTPEESIPGTNYNRAATVEVTDSWKGLIGGTVEVLYEDGGMGSCNSSHYFTGPTGKERTLFFLKKVKDRYVTSTGMGTARESLVEAAGGIGALRFLKGGNKSKKEFDEFREKHKKEMKYLNGY